MHTLNPVGSRGATGPAPGMGPGNAAAPATSVMAQAFESAINRLIELPSNRPVTITPSQVSGNATNARSPSAAFSPEGALLPDSIDWLDAAGMNPARATKGPCVFVSCGVFAYLNSGQEALAMPFFEKMMEHGMRGTTANRSAGDALALLQDSGLKVRADLFLSPGVLADEFLANAKSLSRFPGSLTRHVLDKDASSVRLLIDQLDIGEAAMLFIERHHVISIVRGSDGWHVFDTALNPRKNVYKGAQDMFRYPVPASHELKTNDGRNHAHGAEAAALIERYVSVLKTQPVLIRMDRTAPL